MMNKKTGNIITAVVLGLLMLWMSQRVLAEENPIAKVPPPSLPQTYDVITRTTVITEVYATRATVFGMSCSGPNAQWGPFDLENIAGEPDGQYGGILRSIYVDYLGQCGQYSIVFDFGDIYTATSFSAYHYNQISIRDPELSICTNADCWETRDSGYWVWSGGERWWIVSGPDWGGSTIRQDMGVRYLRHKMSGESGDSYGLKFGIDAIKLILAAPITKTEFITVPSLTCDTVTNADFISDTAWIFQPTYSSIHNGYLDMMGYYTSAATTLQDFGIPTHRVYTAEVIAYSAEPGGASAGLYIGLQQQSGSNVLGTMPSITVTANGGKFATYTTTITSPTTVGEEAYLNLSTYNHIVIDYVCLYGENGVCLNPSDREYAYFETGGAGFGSELPLKNWPGININDLSTPTYTPFHRPFLFDGEGDPPAGGYRFEITNSSPGVNSGISTVENNFGIDITGFDEMAAPSIARFDGIAIRSQWHGTLESLVIDVFRNQTILDYNVTVLAKLNSGWQIAGSTTISVGDEEIDFGTFFDGYSVDTVTIPLVPIYPYAEYAILLTATGIPGRPTLFSKPVLAISRIETYGCYSGSAYTDNECIVSDPELNGGASGGPDPYFWSWSDGAITGNGYITLHSETATSLYQNVYALPGQYVADVTLNSLTADRCEVGVRGVTDIFGINDLSATDKFNVTMNCTPLISQTVSMQVDIPTGPFIFSVDARKGLMDIERVCVHLPGFSQCLNQNPDFTNGTQGYYLQGVSNYSGNGILLNPADFIRALPNSSAPFYSGNGPWVLEVTASPVVSDDMVVTAITPGINPSDTTNPANHYFQVTDTQVLTYSFGKTTGQETTALLLESGNGPSVYNNDADGRLHISRYCLMTDTGTTWWGGRECTSLTNPDFELGLTGWTNSNVVPAGTFAVFDTNGYVKQLASPDNLVLNGHFDSGYSGWKTSFGDTISSGSGYSGSGLQFENNKISEAYAYYELNVQPNTQFSAFARIKAESTITASTLFFLRGQTTSTTLSGASTPLSKDFAWHNYIITGNSGANTKIAVYVYRAPGATGQKIWVDDVAVVQGTEIPLQYTEPAEATVHWIARSGVPSELVATVSVSSSNGVFTTSETVGPTLSEFYTPFEIGGDAEVMVSSASPGLQLDFVCLNSGTYTDGPQGPGGPGTPPWVPGVGDGRCAPPPMVVLSTTLTSWMPNIWIWSNQPTNYEVVATYSAAWLRYIGCTLTDMQLMLANKLDIIISKMGATTNGGWADALARIFEALADMVKVIAGIISQLLTLIISIWNALAPGIGLVWQFVATLLELLDLILDLFTDFAGWLLQMVMILANMMLGFITDSATVPGEAFTAWNNAINDPAYDIIPLQVVPSGEVGATATIGIDCTNPQSNNWCMLLFGFEVVNKTIGDTILYPIVIIGLIISTFFVFRNQIWDFYNMKIR